MAKLKIKLRGKERKFLEEFVRAGTKKARAIARANVLLLADEGHSHKEIAKLARVHRQSIWRVLTRYLNEGLESALEEKPRSGQPKKYTEKHEAEIIALACTKPPAGAKRWTLELLVENLKSRKGLKTINRESVRLVLKKTGLSLG